MKKADIILVDKLPPEIDDEGNIEYKRHLLNLDDDRMDQLATQMKWRIAEGNNEAIYYIGVSDDGTPYPLNSEEKKETLNNFTKLLKINNLEITNFQVNKFIDNNNSINSFFRITIRTKTIIYPEVRVLLLGDTSSGKTTFLSNIILGKTDKDSNARIYLMNHKHELENKKTSSFQCYYHIHDNIKYSFLEAPGSPEYIRTKYKIILSTKPDICLLFANQENNLDSWYSFILNQLKIPIIPINIFDPNSDFNCKYLIDKNKLFYIIENKLDTQRSKNIDSIDRTDLKFNILNVYPNNDLGILVSGFLESGTLDINKSINWVYKKNIIKCQVQSIHLNYEPIKKISKPNILTICLKTNFLQECGKIKQNMKYGLIINKIKKPINRIKFKYENFNQSELKNNLVGYCLNNVINLINISKNDNIYEAEIYGYYYDFDIIIIDNELNKGIIYVIKD